MNLQTGVGNILPFRVMGAISDNAAFLVVLVLLKTALLFPTLIYWFNYIISRGDAGDLQYLQVS